ncbi:ABC-type transport auxiliary lipoprotein family protein [Sphingomonas bacterium]|uniref:ABC-type transport auxiliary lipoprotein family protein n=1 Tax=Sphingomonas bacterium TaxID=1895847 RepID=UPI0020C5ECBF|nr:ABC-type transport auxiliary lipoprotein family protein [Sphingomonas bacterium]
MMIIRRLSAPALPLLLAGCISLGPKTPATLMALTPSATVSAGAAKATSDERSIAVNIPTAQPALATQRVMVQDGPNAVAYVKDAQWVAAPALLFRNLVAETITARTGRYVPDQRATGLQPDLRISGQLVQFGLDGPGMAAVVMFDGVLARSGSTTLQTRRFEARVPIGSTDGPAAAVGINQAANRVAEEIAGWIGGG